MRTSANAGPIVRPPTTHASAHVTTAGASAPAKTDRHFMNYPFPSIDPRIAPHCGNTSGIPRLYAEMIMLE
jgi:hypothetical protein